MIKLSDFVHDRKKDGNTFNWILDAAEKVRELRRKEINAIKEAAKESKGLDATKVAY